METDKRVFLSCQIHSVPTMSDGLVDLEALPLRRRIRLWLKRMLDARTKRRLKQMIDAFRTLFLARAHFREQGSALKDANSVLTTLPAAPVASGAEIKAGDYVRVRTRAEVESTLDSWDELKHCVVMPDMWQYCGTTQRVYKVVERFVDERDYRLKKGTGIVLLDGLICQGTADFGRCDRSCFYFWRAEWLEKMVE